MFPTGKLWLPMFCVAWMVRRPMRSASQFSVTKLLGGRGKVRKLPL
jgi:hypothetical protein